MRCSVDDAERWHAAALAEGRTLSEVVRELLEEWEHLRPSPEAKERFRRWLAEGGEAFTDEELDRVAEEWEARR